MRSHACAAALPLLLAIAAPAAVSAQAVEVAPFAGYRFGGDLFEAAVDHPLDTDGAPAFGGTVSIPLWDGMWFEGLYSRQQADVEIDDWRYASPFRTRAIVEHWMGGGRQDFGRGRARPFMTGLVGLTHYAADGDHEIRFALGAGGGVKVRLQRHLDLRLDGRVFTTFVYLDAAGVCGNGCFVGLDVDVAWQAEFTAGFAFVF